MATKAKFQKGQKIFARGFGKGIQQVTVKECGRKVLEIEEVKNNRYSLEFTHKDNFFATFDEAQTADDAAKAAEAQRIQRLQQVGK